MASALGVVASGTERDDIVFTADVVVGVFVELAPTALEAGTTGGVDEPSRDGIEIDERDEVDDTGEGTAMALVVTPLLAVVLAVGASKFDIVGECFLLTPGSCVAGDATIDCLELGDETEVEVLVHVVGTLLATVVAAAADLPFGIVTAALGC